MELQEALDRIKGLNNQKSFDPRNFIANNRIEEGPNVIKNIKADVPVDAIYTRLSDGSFSAKYENYQGATGNEDRLAREQGVLDQAVSGLGKFAIKTGSYALDNTVGFTYGLLNGIEKGSFSAIWDNDFSTALDDFNKELDNNLANYYTDEEKNRGMLSAIPGFGATNFWFDKVGGGLAFVTGALLPEIALGVVTGGASVGLSAAKMSAKYGGKSLLKLAAKEAGQEVIEQTAKSGLKSFTSKIPMVTQYKVGSKAIRNLNRKIYKSKEIGDAVSTISFLGRSSGFEAGVEARSNYHDAVEGYIQTFEQKNGRRPEMEELSTFMEDAKKAANGVFAANMALLSVSNAVMFADKMNIGTGLKKSLDNFGNSAIGLGIESAEGVGKVALQEASRGTKILGNAYKILAKPATEGLYEEGMQGVAGKTMQNYLSAKYFPKSDQTYDTMAAFTDALAEQYGSAHGWEEMGIGMIIGSGAGVFQGGGVAGVGKNSWKARRKELQGQVNLLNQGMESLSQNINKSTAMFNLNKQRVGGKSVSPIVDTEGSLINKDFIQTQETFKDQSEILKDYEAVVDQRDLTEEEVEAIGGVDNIPHYRAKLKEKFKQDLDNYNQAKKVVEALGVGRYKADKGNILEVQDQMITAMMIGYTSEQGAKDIAQRIDQLAGTSGVFDHANFVASLDTKKREALEKVEQKRKRANDLREAAEKYYRESVNEPADGANAEKAEKASELYLRLTEEANQLDTEIEEISKSLSTAETFATGKFGLAGTDSFAVDGGVLQATEQLSKLDGFIQALKEDGRINEANELLTLTQEMKNQLDASREIKKAFFEMSDGDFLGSTKGKGLIGKMIGPKFQMDEETAKLISQNEDKINKSLGLVGIRGEATVMETVDTLITNNKNLSDRDKHKIISYVRRNLTQNGLRNQAEKLQNKLPKVETVPVASFGQGDTISIEGNPTIDGESLRDLNTLDRVIAQMEKAIEDYRKSGEYAVKDPEVSNSINKVTKLRAKEQTEGLTPEEQTELEDLNQEIDDWVLAMGAVYQGYRLSDLIRQREVLKNTPIEDVQKIDLVTDSDLADSVEIADRSSKGNPELTQHYDAATATMIKDSDGKGTPKVEIANIKPETLLDKVGFNFLYTMNEKNNILIDMDVMEQINENSDVRIDLRKDQTGSNFTIVTERSANLKGGFDNVPLKSDFNEDFTEPMDTDALYRMPEESAVRLEIDPLDEFNLQLIEEYKKTGDKEDLKNRLVIRVLDQAGNFVAVLKGKNKSDKVFKGNRVFDNFRDQVAEDADVLEHITTSTTPMEISDHNITVKEVLIGHPVTLQGDPIRLTENDKAVTDIGYVENGKTWTVNNKSGEIDLRFLNRTMKKANPDTKIPFIVIERGGRKIAYPAKINEQENSAAEEMRRIFESNSREIDKAIAMNKILASRGIDIKLRGEGFIVTKDFPEISVQQFNDKIAQLESIPYFQDLNSWKSQTMEQILSNGIFHNLNLENPITSPKLRLDYSKLKPDALTVSESVSRAGRRTSSVQGIKANKDQADDNIKKPCGK